MNRLQHETSPYLRQHAGNPVDWWPWCDAAFEEARARGVPIFLSIGYAACHWCHVMERESFEDPLVASLMNERFVNIKVDREEHPAVDAFYMDALMAMGQPAGWPASLWLNHERMPLYGGTYYPPVFRYGTPAFTQVLQSMSEGWRSGSNYTHTLDQVRESLTVTGGDKAALDPEVVAAALAGLHDAWDTENAGWGQGAKFPMPPNLELLLDQAVCRGDALSETRVRAALDAMDRGGIHDHLGGGFHRYAVDSDWAVPHFEKMLYDNAQLLRLYAQAAAVFDEPRWAAVARGIVGWLMREMRAPSGAFYASQDADSQDDRGRAEEGAFYTWTRAELKRLLPGPQAARFAAAYSVDEYGNFEGRSTLRWREDEPSAPALAGARAALLKARRLRSAPPTDDKIVVGWNGLVVSGLARAGRLLGKRAWVMAAATAAEVLLAGRDSQGGLPRVLSPSAPAGTCKDHAFVAEGLLDLHEATGEARWLVEAAALARVMVDRFFESESGLFYRAADSSLPLRRPDLRDGAEPSGTSRALEVLRRLSMVGLAEEVVVSDGLAAALASSEEPAGDAGLALVLDRVLAPGQEVILSTPALDHPGMSALLAAWNARWRPRAQLGVITPEAPAVLAEASGFAGRSPRADSPRAYVCQGRACSLPTADGDALRALLDSEP